MNTITVEHHVTPVKLDVLFVEDWPVWSKDITEFEWTYEQKETCYIVEGKAIITTEDGENLTIESGDMVFFPQGLKCVWKIIEPVEKHYKLG